jgi:hypothetical protein
MTDLSKAEKLLIAAGDLTSAGQEEFSAEDLAVRAHKLFVHDFAMKGHIEHPDSNVVFTQVMGKKAALIIRGWLEKTGTKQYKLTPKGLDDLNHLVEQGRGGQINVRVDRKFEDRLGHLLTSPAYQLFGLGQKDEITFHQFCRFAELSARDKWQKIQGKLNSLEHLVGEARKLGEAGEGVSIWVQSHNQKFSPDDLRMLEPLLRFLMARFKPEMDQWKRNALA